MKSIFVLFCILIETSVFSEENKTYQLELVQALFRHGDRIPDKREVYKTDPYDPEYYEPPGYGQLTNVGMQRAYRIGLMLRKLYKNFLGEYKANKVYAYSTDTDRTKASLQLVLSALFPPLIQSAWNKQVMWFPIPIHYRSRNSDFLRSTFEGSCGSISKLQPIIEKVPEVQEHMAQYKDFLNHVRNKTEITDIHIFNLAFLNSNLVAIRSMNLPLPPWCSEQDFKTLNDIAAFVFKSLSITSALRKQIAGPMVKQFLDNMKNHKEDDERKIYLYSAHDTNIAPYTRAHNFSNIPPLFDFGSTVIIEKLRGSDGESYVRMFLWSGIGEKLTKLKLENCDYECPLSTYEKIVEPVLPEPELVECITRNLYCAGESPSKAIKIPSKTFMRLLMTMSLLLLQFLL